MAKDPAMLWYWSDWHGGTSTLNRFLKGCYMDLLNAQFNSGHLSMEEIKTVLGVDFDQAWPVLKKKFSADPDGNFFNVRLDEEKIKRANWTASRRKNLSHKEPHMINHMDQHMENANINEDINVIGIKEEVQEKPKTPKEIHDLVFAEPNFIRNLKDSHPGKDYERAWAECFAYHSNRPNPPNQLWVWRQKVLTWLSNMKEDKPKAATKKKLSFQDLKKTA